MSKMIQIRHVPDELHQRIRKRAALAGMSLSDYLRQELERSAKQLTPAEVLERLKAMPGIKVREKSADIIRKMRGPL